MQYHLNYKYYIVILFCFYFSSFSQDSLKNSVLLDQIVLTAQYKPIHIDSSIYVVDIIPNKSLKNFGSQNLSSVLNRQVGVSIFHDPFLGDYIDFQGISGENIKVLIDGVEIYGFQNGSVDFSQITLGNIDRIEIIDSPLSTVYGNNSLGSTINLISKTKQNEKINFSVESHIESIGQYNFNTNLGYKLDESIFFVSLGRHYFDGWSPNDKISLFSTSYFADNSRHHLWKPKEKMYLKLNYIYKTSNDLMIKPYIDLLNEEVTNKGLPRGAFFNYAFDDYYLNRKFDKGVVIKGPFLNRNIDVLFNHNRYFRHKQQYYVDLTNLVQNKTDDNDTTIVDLFTHRVTCSNIENSKINYQYGYSISSELLKTQRLIDAKQQRIDFSFFSSLDYTINKLSFRTAFRYLYSLEHNDRFTPAINLKLNLGKTFLRCSYAHGFRTPSLKEMYFNFVDVNHNIQGNSNLQSEESKNFQINLNSSILNNYNFSWKIFYNRINNFITLIQNENTANFDYINIGNYRTIGSKSQIKFSILKTDVNFNVAYLGNSSIYNQDLNFYLMFNTLLKYQLNSRHAFSFFSSFKGPRSIVLKNNYGEILSKKIDSYSILNISYDLNINDMYTFSFGCNNLLNIQDLNSETIIGSFHNNESTGIPLACGRYFYTSIKMNFIND